MQKKYFIHVGLIVAVLVASFLVLNASAPAARQDKSTCCQKTMQKCVETEKKTEAPLSLENISQQFISIAPLIH